MHQNLLRSRVESGRGMLARQRRRGFRAKSATHLWYGFSAQLVLQLPAAFYSEPRVSQSGDARTVHSAVPASTGPKGPRRPALRDDQAIRVDFRDIWKSVTTFGAMPMVLAMHCHALRAPSLTHSRSAAQPRHLTLARTRRYTRRSRSGRSAGASSGRRRCRTRCGWA